MEETQSDIVVELPIYIRLGKSEERFSLNLNVYRNAHFHTLSSAKLRFEDIVAKRITQLPVMLKTDLTYRLFFGSNRAIDVSNICCIVDKFFCDTLVNQKKLVDDNMHTISDINYRWGGIDPQNPRVEVTLSNIRIKEEDVPMQIILTQQEIEDLIRDSVLAQITVREDQGISLTFEEFEGKVGFNAVIRIQKLGTEEVSSPKKVRTSRRVGVPVQGGTQAEPQAEEPVQEEPAKAHVEPLPAPTVEGEPVELVLAPKAAPAVAASRIFPDSSTSAPAQPQAPAAAPAAAPPPAAVVPPSKSLFANLTKPIHDTPGSSGS